MNLTCKIEKKNTMKVSQRTAGELHEPSEVPWRKYRRGGTTFDTDLNTLYQGRRAQSNVLVSRLLNVTKYHIVLNACVEKED